MKFDQNRIIVIGFLTLVLFPLLGFVLYWIVEGDYNDILDSFKSEVSVLVQVLIGTIVGTIFGWLAWLFVKSEYMKPVLNKYGQVVKSLNLKVITIFFLSFCAGVGEEFFFRGILQEYLGVIITAIVFVLIHGYLNPFDKIIFSYGLLMTTFIIGLGYMDVFLGLISAMTAHMMIDVVLFYKLSTTDLLRGGHYTKEDAEIFENNPELLP